FMDCCRQLRHTPHCSKTFPLGRNGSCCGRRQIPNHSSIIGCEPCRPGTAHKVDHAVLHPVCGRWSHIQNWSMAMKRRNPFMEATETGKPVCVIWFEGKSVHA